MNQNTMRTPSFKNLHYARAHKLCRTDYLTFANAGSHSTSFCENMIKEFLADVRARVELTRERMQVPEMVSKQGPKNRSIIVIIWTYSLIPCENFALKVRSFPSASWARLKSSVASIVTMAIQRDATAV